VQFHVDGRFQLKVLIFSLILLFIQYKPIEDTVLSAFFVLYDNNFYHALFIILLFVLTLTLLHESIHAFFYAIFGARLKVGFMGINPYLIDSSKKHFSIIRYSIIILSPLVFISLFSLLFKSLLGSLIFYFNLFCSTGDIMLTLSLSSYSKGSEFTDESYGYKVYQK